MQNKARKKQSKKSNKTVLWYALPILVAQICGLSSGAKELFAVMIFNAWGRPSCRIGVGSMANCLGTDRRSIRRWLLELVRFGLIKVGHERGCCYYYLNPKHRVGPTIPLLDVVMKRKDIGQAYKLLMCWLSYRQGANEWTWAMQKVLAEELGLTVRTIQRTLCAMKANAEVQIRLRKRNSKSGNKYALTCGAVLGGRIFGDNSHTTVCTHLNKKVKAKSYLDAIRHKFLSQDLSKNGTPDSFGEEVVFAELIGCGIHKKVAGPMAFEDKHPFESAVQVIDNAKILRAVVWKRAREVGLPDPRFNVAGYVVRALNGARKEGKIVGTTRLFRQAGEKSRELKAAKARRERRKPLSEAQFERRRWKLIRSLGLTA